jgi:integrase
LPDARPAEIHEAAATTGDDAAPTRCCGCTPGRHAVAGVRLNPRRVDLDQEQCLIRLREKGGTRRRQPVSPTLMAALLAHRQERGDGHPTSGGQLLRYDNRRPITYRRYDGPWRRIVEHLPWAAT